MRCAAPALTRARPALPAPQPPPAPGAAPYQPQSAGGPYSYLPITTFANNWGHLAAVRCLGSRQPGSLCIYNGYEGRAISAARRRRQRGAAAAAAAAAAVAWLLL